MSRKKEQNKEIVITEVLKVSKSLDGVLYLTPAEKGKKSNVISMLDGDGTMGELEEDLIKMAGGKAGCKLQATLLFEPTK